MIKTNQHHLELFHLATKLDKNKNFDLSDHIYELMTRLSQIDNPPIDLSLGGPDAANNPKNAVDYFIGVAYDAVVNKKKDKESALKAMDHYRKRQNKEVLEPEEQIQTDSEFWQSVNSVLETKDWWQSAQEKPASSTANFNSTDGFKLAVKIVLGLEGGFSEYDSSTGDPRTNKGITQDEYNEFRRKNNLSEEDVKNIPTSEAVQIYKENYWDKIQGDKIYAVNPKLAILIFDSAVNLGIGGANEVVKKSIPTDGNRFDNIMIEDIIASSENTVDDLFEKRQQKYDDIIAKDSAMGKYDKGWTNRLNKLKNTMNQF